jgi:hypothetical protein
VPVTVESPDGKLTFKKNMQQEPELKNGFTRLASIALDAGESCSVTVSAAGAGGHACADAVQLVPVK